MDNPEADNPNDRRPRRTVWGWDRVFSDNNTWVMPDYDGWSSLGSGFKSVAGYSQFRERVHELEQGTTFEKKVPKALWRGTVGLANPYVPHTRKDLIAASKDKE